MLINYLILPTLSNIEALFIEESELIVVLLDFNICVVRNAQIYFSANIGWEQVFWPFIKECTFNFMSFLPHKLLCILEMLSLSNPTLGSLLEYDKINSIFYELAL